MVGRDKAIEWATAILGENGRDHSDAKPNALLVLKRTQTQLGNETRLKHVNLRGTIFTNENLVRADLEHADLSDAKLDGANLYGANLRGAVLARADLTRAKLIDAFLSDVDASGACFLGANLRGATLSGSDLRFAKMVGADLHGDALSECNTFGAALPNLVRPEVMHACSSPFTSVSFGSSGLIATGHDDGTIRLWDGGSGVELRTLSSLEYPVTAVQFTQDGEALAGAGEDGTVIIFRAIGNLEPPLVARTHSTRVTSLAFSPDGRLLASASIDETVRVLKVSDGDRAFTLVGHDQAVQDVTFSSDGLYIVTGSLDYTARVWDGTTGRLIRVLYGHVAAVNAVAFLADCKRLITASADKTLRIWDWRTSEVLRVFVGHEGGITSASLAEADNRVITGSVDKTVRVWDLANANELHVFKGHQRHIVKLAVGGESRLASVDGDRTLRLWNCDEGREYRNIFARRTAAHRIEDIGDGFIQSVHDDFCSTWDARNFVQSGQIARDYEDGAELKRDIPWINLDRETRVSISSDGAIRVWNRVDDSLRATLVSSSDGWVSFTPNGRYQVGGNPAGAVWYAASLCRFEFGRARWFSSAGSFGGSAQPLAL